MIYLACPYTHPNPKVEAVRAHEASRAAAELTFRGLVVFSPITHGHAIRVAADPARPIGGSWDTWSGVDLSILPICERLAILGLVGWLESRGIRREIAVAIETDVPVEVLDPKTLGPAGPWSAEIIRSFKDAGVVPDPRPGEMDNSLSDRGGR